MFGAILGDVIGSAYEFSPVRSVCFDALNPKSDFTDDSVLTLATAEVLLDGGDYGDAYWTHGNAYPGRGYGGRFAHWLYDGGERAPYNSFGNGSAMRVAPIGWRFDSLQETLDAAKASAACTHNHPEGIKGAQATAAAIFLARNGKSKDGIKSYIEQTFQYDLSRNVDETRKTSRFDETCQVSVPEALIAFLCANDYEETVRFCVSYGADADTQAAIAGGIAEAYWNEAPKDWIRFAWNKLDAKQQTIIQRFYKLYMPNSSFLSAVL